jgi:N-acyl-D-amino-acid deacylase
VLDVILRNGRILDGSGNPWYRGDVGIQGNQIVAVGRVETDDAGRTIDCGGRIVSPGFIDMHSHADVMLLAEPRHEGKTYQGVTTDLLGQDGLSYAPVTPKTLALLRRHLAALNGNPDVGWDWTSVATFLDRFDQKVSTNVAFLVPHCAVRAEILGMEDRLPTAAELEQMCQLVAASPPAWTTPPSSGPTRTSWSSSARLSPGAAASTSPICGPVSVIASSIRSRRRSRSAEGQASRSTSRTSAATPSGRRTGRRTSSACTRRPAPRASI